MTILYHSRDLDGYCSGAICKLKYPDAKLIGYDYGQPLPVIENAADEDVIMVDVSVDPPEMEQYGKTFKSFTWIDHHISAIKKWKAAFPLQDMPEDHNEVFIGGIYSSFNKVNIKVVLQNGIAACEITWNYLFPDKRMPDAVKFLGQYDTWRKKEVGERWDTEILPFQFGMRLNCNSAETFHSFLLASIETQATHQIDPDQYSLNLRRHEQQQQLIKEIIFKGEIVLKYQSQTNLVACKKAFEFEFEGLRAICLNGGGFNSDVFKSVYDESKHDIMMPFAYDGKNNHWIVSIYSTKPEIDCSAIAKKHGGGGHKGAAGFQVTDIRDIIPIKTRVPSVTIVKHQHDEFQISSTAPVHIIDQAGIFFKANENDKNIIGIK